MRETDQEELRRRLTELRVEHQDLDAAISALAASPAVDQIQLRRLKKRKLQLKEAIERLQSRLIPDLNA